MKTLESMGINIPQDASIATRVAKELNDSLIESPHSQGNLSLTDIRSFVFPSPTSLSFSFSFQIFFSPFESQSLIRRLHPLHVKGKQDEFLSALDVQMQIWCWMEVATSSLIMVLW